MAITNIAIAKQIPTSVPVLSLSVGRSSLDAFCCSAGLCEEVDVVKLERILLLANEIAGVNVAGCDV
jgi:hypothetical protein